MRKRRRLLALVSSVLMTATMFALPYGVAAREEVNSSESSGQAKTSYLLTNGDGNSHGGHAMQWGYYLTNQGDKQDISLSQFGKRDVTLRFQAILHKADGFTDLEEQLTSALKAVLPEENKEDVGATITEVDWLPYIRTPRVTLKTPQSEGTQTIVNQISAEGSFVKQDSTWVWDGSISVPASAMQSTLGRVEVLMYNDLHTLLNDRYKAITGANGSFTENEWGSKGVHITLGEQTLVIGSEEIVTRWNWNNNNNVRKGTDNFGFDWSAMAVGVTGSYDPPHDDTHKGMDLSDGAGNWNPYYVLKAEFTFTDVGGADRTADDAWNALHQIIFRMRSFKTESSNGEPGWNYLHLANREEKEKDWFSFSDDGKTLYMSLPLSAMNGDTIDKANVVQINVTAERIKENGTAKDPALMEMTLSNVRVVDTSRDALQQAVTDTHNYLYAADGVFATALAKAKTALQGEDTSACVSALDALKTAMSQDKSVEDHSKLIAADGPSEAELASGSDWMKLKGVTNDQTGVHLYGDLNKYALQITLTTEKESLRAAGFDKDYLIELRHNTGGEHVQGWYVNLQELPGADQQTVTVSIPLTPSTQDHQWGKDGPKVAEGIYIYRSRTNNNDDDVRDILHYITETRIAKNELKAAGITASNICVVDHTRAMLTDEVKTATDVTDTATVTYVKNAVALMADLRAQADAVSDATPLQDIADLLMEINAQKQTLIKTAVVKNFDLWVKKHSTGVVNSAENPQHFYLDWAGGDATTFATDVSPYLVGESSEDQPFAAWKNLNLKLKFHFEATNGNSLPDETVTAQMIGLNIRSSNPETGAEEKMLLADYVREHLLNSMTWANNEWVIPLNAGKSENNFAPLNETRVSDALLIMDVTNFITGNAYKLVLDEAQIVYTAPTVTVSFLGKYDEEVVRKEVVSAEGLKTVLETTKAPALGGYQFRSWDVNIEQEYQLLFDTACEREDRLVTVTAVYEEKPNATQYTLSGLVNMTARDGEDKAVTQATQLAFDQRITVTSTENEVAYWILDGAKVGFGQKTYTFYVSGNNTINVVFDGGSEVTPEVVLQQAVGATGSDGNNTLSVIAQTSVPTGYTLTECGVYYTGTVAALKDVKAGTAQADNYVQVVSSKKAGQQYMTHLLNVQSGKIRYAMAYAVLEKNDGTEATTIWSDTVVQFKTTADGVMFVKGSI